MDGHARALFGLALAAAAVPAFAQDGNDSASYEVPDGVYHCKYEVPGRYGYTGYATITVDGRWRHGVSTNQVGRLLTTGGTEEQMYRYADGGTPIHYQMDDIQTPVEPIPILRRGRCTPAGSPGQ